MKSTGIITREQSALLTKKITIFRNESVTKFRRDVNFVVTKHGADRCVLLEYIRKYESAVDEFIKINARLIGIEQPPMTHEEYETLKVSIAKSIITAQKEAYDKMKELAPKAFSD